MREEKILIVDDKLINRKILRKIFEKEYGILEADNGVEALEILKENSKEIMVILLDIKMPIMDGFEVLANLKVFKMLEKIPVVMITADQNISMEQKGFKEGVADFIYKPFNAMVVYRRVRNVIDLYRHKNNLEELVRKQTVKIQKQADEINGKLIDALSTVVEFRDLETGEHIARIKIFTKLLAERIAIQYPEYLLNSKKIDLITSASALHDIGKIAISDKILLKPGRLTEEEFEVMKGHTNKGGDILKQLDFIKDQEFFKYCYEICKFHHEKYDGNGYPEGLEGDQIPIAAQIVSVADVFDALASERIYKKKFDPEVAYIMVLSGKCGKFNPKILKCFLELKPKFIELANELN